MLTIIFLMIYLLPGLALARGMYSEQVRAINSKPSVVVPPQPPRPRIRIVELLHVGGSKPCALVKTSSAAACTCITREEWINLKNEWADYDEWIRKYAHIKNGVEQAPKVQAFPIYASVPVWPLVAAGMYIKGGAKRIPDYREIERLEEVTQIPPMPELE